MVTVSGSEYPEVIPGISASIALALTWYVPDLLQLCDAVTLISESNGPITEVDPSPQSNIYCTWFPSGSVADVE